LLNLRFSGWHRYKATNTISLIYQNNPIIQDQTQGQTDGLLPVGRSLFRDKRIPRENLNGLVIEKTGLSRVIYHLTNIGSSWAQDPPFYAQVEHFETSPSIDTSRTLIHDWNGWQHLRTINFIHQGIIVIEDLANGPKNQNATVFWHLPESLSNVDNRIVIRGGDHPIEMVLIPLEGNSSQNSLQFNPENGTGLAVQYLPSPDGTLSLVTILLADHWVGAEADIIRSTNGLMLQLKKGNQTLDIPINERL